MKANVVLAGGGAKGAVLAGCVNAAITKGVLPAGFGGTSAGAIVAFLAAIGYRGDALRSLVVDTTLADLLDDGGAAIDGITRDLGWLGTRLAAGTDLGIGGLLGLVAGVGWCEGSALVRDLGRAIARWPRSILARCPGLAGFRPPPQSELPQRWTPIRVTRLLVTRLGLHDGRALRRWLADRIVERGLATADEAATLTFAELAEKPGCVPLRVVATDARSRRPVVFGDGDHAALSVIDAVVASARFPLLFRPADLAGMCLTDGGLSSNLPAFLFEDAHAATGVRTLAFDLVEEPAREGSGGAERDGVNYLRSLASCAVEASDVLLRRSTAGVEYYPIPVPPGIGVLSFRIDRKARHACYDRGFSRASELIDRAEWYVRMQLVAEGLQARLIAEHGSPDLFEPILRALMDQISSMSDEGLDAPRASIALVTSRGAATKRIVTYSLGMDDDPDSDLEMDATAGCSGRAWEDCGVAVADVQEGRERPEDWGMTAAQYAKIPRRVRAIISVPILDDPETSRPAMHPLGTISVDCRTALSDTGWVDESGSMQGQHVVDQEVEDILWAWSRVIHALLIRAA
jgi:NTE family protein